MSEQTNIHTKKSSSAHGSHHWLHQRYTALANLLLMPWLLINVICMAKTPKYELTDFLSAPHNAILTILVLFSVFYHGTLGIQVVIEDYVHKKAVKWGMLIGLKFLAILFCFAGIFSVLLIYYYLNFKS